MHLPSGSTAYLVGGAVRDQLLNRSSKDRDWVVVGSTPEAMQAAGFRPVGLDFPVFLHPATQEEYALARTERKSGHGYGGFEFFAAPTVSLEDDLVRRDLTINAIAQKADGTLVDPHEGQHDIEQRLLRHVSSAFTEDPLRVLRIARFAAQLQPWGFSVADDTMVLLKQIVNAGELDHLTPERVWQETLKALISPSPRRFVEVLRACGALKVIFPEIERMFGVPQKPQWHPEIDCGEHLLLALDRAVDVSDDPAVRFGVFVHDLGKGVTPDHILPSHHGHEERGVPLVTELSERLRVPKNFRQLGEKISRYHLQCHKAFELKPQTVLKLITGLDGIRKPDVMTQFTLACEADARGRLGFANRPYPQGQWLRELNAELRHVRLDETERQDQHGNALSGEHIGKALHNKRLNVVKHWVKAQRALA